MYSHTSTATAAQTAACPAPTSGRSRHSRAGTPPRCTAHHPARLRSAKTPCASAVASRTPAAAAAECGATARVRRTLRVNPSAQPSGAHPKDVEDVADVERQPAGGKKRAGRDGHGERHEQERRGADDGCLGVQLPGPRRVRGAERDDGGEEEQRRVELRRVPRAGGGEAVRRRGAADKAREPRAAVGEGDERHEEVVRDGRRRHVEVEPPLVKREEPGVRGERGVGRGDGVRRECVGDGGRLHWLRSRKLAAN